MICPIHGRVTSYVSCDGCRECRKTYQKARQKAIRDGTWDGHSRGKKAKVKR